MIFLFALHEQQKYWLELGYGQLPMEYVTGEWYIVNITLFIWVPGVIQWIIDQ